MRASLVIIGLAVIAAGCTQQAPRTPPPAPAPVAVAPPAAPPAADWRDWPATPGTWSYRRDGRGSIALFGVPGSDASMTLRCDLAGRQVYLSRAGVLAGPLTIRTTSVTRMVAVQPTGGLPRYVALAMSPRDPLLDAMGFSRGRFVVEQAGAPPLVVPAWAEIERVTEDCRG